MVKSLFKSAEKFEAYLGREDNSLDKLAAPRGAQKCSKKKLNKRRGDSLKNYHEKKKLLSQLQSERDSLDARLNQTKEDMEKSRTDMLQLNDVLRNMDLLDCNYVMMYNNSDDIGYLIDKEEHHLSVDDQGDISLTPMKEHRRSVRQQDQSNTDDDSLDAFDGIFDIERLSDPTAPRTEEEFNEGKLPDHHPNLRFGE